MIDTAIVKVDPERPEGSVIEAAAGIIRRGGLVAFPTETVYGLGADAMNGAAVRRLFDAKGRPADNPLILHIASSEMLSRVAEDIPRRAEALAQRFWPGPLTFVLRRRPEVPETVSAGLPTVAVRLPANAVAVELIRRADTPIAAPSANTSGRPSPTRAAHVAADLGGRIDMILDGGDTRIGIESTVVDLTTDPPVVLRPGWITRDAIAQVIGPVEQAASANRLRRSPGTLHRHYKPRARLILVEGLSPDEIRGVCAGLLELGSVAFVGHSPVNLSAPSFARQVLGSSPAAYAHSIYAALREMDARDPGAIVVEGIVDEAEGAAVMDRLRRAATERIVSEKG